MIQPKSNYRCHPDYLLETHSVCCLLQMSLCELDTDFYYSFIDIGVLEVNNLLSPSNVIGENGNIQNLQLYVFVG